MDGYKKQAAKHIVAASPQAFEGRLPEILKSVVVLDLTVDREGKVVKASVRRSNGYKELEATALESVRRAGRLPAPTLAVHRGAPTISYVETWLFRDDGSSRSAAWPSRSRSQPRTDRLPKAERAAVARAARAGHRRCQTELLRRTAEPQPCRRTARSCSPAVPPVSRPRRTSSSSRRRCPPLPTGNSWCAITGSRSTRTCAGGWTR
jgi:TonB family protein